MREGRCDLDPEGQLRSEYVSWTRSRGAVLLIGSYFITKNVNISIVPAGRELADIFFLIGPTARTDAVAEQGGAAPAGRQRHGGSLSNLHHSEFTFTRSPIRAQPRVEMCSAIRMNYLTASSSASTLMKLSTSSTS